MTSVREMFPTRWLKAGDLNGRAFALTITAARIEELYNPRTRQEEPKIVVSFHAARKELICNKTQLLAIAAITGEDETDNWQGHSITLSAGTAPNGQPTIIISPPPDPEATIETAGAAAAESETKAKAEATADRAVAAYAAATEQQTESDSEFDIEAQAAADEAYAAAANPIIDG